MRLKIAIDFRNKFGASQLFYLENSTLSEEYSMILLKSINAVISAEKLREREIPSNNI